MGEWKRLVETAVTSDEEGGKKISVGASSTPVYRGKEENNNTMHY